ncbi:MAG: hypothetical protein AABY22_06350, partial [Nanoarchaeota archaeon]
MEKRETKQKKVKEKKERTAEEQSKVIIRESGNGYIIEITNTPIDYRFAVTKDELRQIVLYGQV